MEKIQFILQGEMHMEEIETTREEYELTKPVKNTSVFDQKANQEKFYILHNENEANSRDINICIVNRSN